MTLHQLGAFLAVRELFRKRDTNLVGFELRDDSSDTAVSRCLTQEQREKVVIANEVKQSRIIALRLPRTLRVLAL